MAGADSSNAWLPAEAKAAMKTELQHFVSMKMEDYLKSSYQAVCLSEAIRNLLPKAAVIAAKKADVVILYISGHSAWSGKDRTEGEGQDTANIDLPSQQVDLVNAVTDVGRPTVAVV